MTAANQGRLSIDQQGQMTAEVEQGGPATAHKLYTSLDGVSFSAGN